MKDNPFCYSGAIERVEQFYNRWSEVRSIFRLLHESQNVEITGPRKIGKTSLLAYISDPAVLREYNMDPCRNLFVHVDCQHRLIQQAESQVYQRMLQCILDAVRKAGVNLAIRVPNGPEVIAAFQQALKETTRLGLKTILLLDGFEAIVGNRNLDIQFFNNQRALGVAYDIDMTYVVTSCAHLGDLCLERPHLLGSPFFNVFHPIRLGLFGEQDSRQLIADSLRRADARLPRELQELVLQVGGGHPFFLQLAGYCALEIASGDEELSEDKRKAFLEVMDKEARQHFDLCWQKLDKQECYILAVLPLVWRSLGFQKAIENLRDECLIVRRGGKCDYFSPLFETFVRCQTVSGVLQAGPLAVDQRRRLVLLRKEPVNLNSTSYALLAHLMQRDGRVVSYDELCHAIGSDEPCGSRQRLQSNIRSLRRVLGDDADCIVTVRGKGYMFEAPVRWLH